MARLEILRLVLAITSSRNWFVYHLNVKSTFLNGTLKEITFVTKLPCFEVKGKKHMVYKLNKALYVLKKALEPRAREYANFLFS